jgi:hypothetical protein
MAYGKRINNSEELEGKLLFALILKRTECVKNLSERFGVSRQCFYLWLNGRRMSRESLQVIRKLSIDMCSDCEREMASTLAKEPEIGERAITSLLERKVS